MKTRAAVACSKPRSRLEITRLIWRVRRPREVWSKSRRPVSVNKDATTRWMASTAKEIFPLDPRQ